MAIVEICSTVPIQVQSLMLTVSQSTVSVMLPQRRKEEFRGRRISEREYKSINETNAMLDIHPREYEDAAANGTSPVDMEALREVQNQELKFAQMKRLKARQLDQGLAN
ncbi:hypothetical protein BDZ45DRAFT_738309 [Acephala macrosclerotiorum]|nr:hypothetical protein BDZ45DRAFT_738309 [Acephala macrosclerotiorum]